jgi:phage-related protein
LTAPIDRAYVEILPQFKGFNEKIRAEVSGAVGGAGRELEKMTQGVGAGVEKVTHHSAGLFTKLKENAKELFSIWAPLAAGFGVLEFIKGSIEAAGEAGKINRQTAAAIKSTGEAAHVTATEIHAMAEELSKQTGVTGDVIQNNENLLLTFTNIRNEVGRGNDIFNQATAAVLDMSVALKEDGKSAAIQLGKALNDPIKGITALSRVGVAFTEEQKKQISAMVDAGNVMGAQKVILAELNKEFGGSAVAQSSMGAKMRAAYHEIEVAVGMKLLPVMKVFSTFMVTTLLPGFMKVIEQTGDGETTFGRLTHVVGDVLTVVGRLAKAGLGVLREAWSAVNPLVQEFAGYLDNRVLPAVSKFADRMGKDLADALKTVGGFIREHKDLMQDLAISLAAAYAATRLFTGAVIAYSIVVNTATKLTVLWRGVLEFIAWAKLIASVRSLRDAWILLDVAMNANWIAVVVIAIAALVAGVIYAYKHFKTFRDIVDAVWHGIVAVSMWAWNNVLKPIVAALVVAWQAVATAALWLWHNVLDPAWHGISSVVQWAWKNVIYPVFQSMSLIISTVGSVAMWLWHNVIEPVARGIAAAISVAWTVMRPVFMLIGAFLGILGDIFMFFWHNVVEPVWAGIKFASQVAAIFLQVIWVGIQIGIKAVQGVFMVLWEIAKFVWSAIQLAIQAAWFVIKPIWDAIVTVINVVVIPGFKFLWIQIQTIWNAISSIISSVWNSTIKPVLDAFGNFIKNHVEPAFREGIRGVQAAWDMVTEIAKKPINFVIGFINQGFIHPFNTLADFFGVNKSSRVSDIPKLATGGLFRGERPGRDTNLAWLTDEEYVINPTSSRRWRPWLDFINNEGRHGRHSTHLKYMGDASQGVPAYGDGGLVGWLKGVGKELWDIITNPGKFVRDMVNSLIQHIPGGEMLVGVIQGMANKLIGGLVGWITGQGGGSGTPASLGAVSNLIKSMVGVPYRWAGASRFGADCSGIVSVAWNALKGMRDIFQHTFSTTDLPGRFFPAPGMGGLLTAGWTNRGESGPGGGPDGVGHMAGWLGPGANGSSGLKFEATGSTGVRVGDAVTPISSFAHVGHFAGGGTVPGPRGHARVAVVHGGEQVLPNEPVDLSDDTIDKLGRAIGRELSGVGRGMLRTARAT